MKIKTTLPAYPVHFVRRATSWVCRRLELPVRQIAADRLRAIEEGLGVQRK